MNPVVAPAGTVVVNVEGVALVTVAVTLLNLTTLFATVELKLFPLIVMVAPGAPLMGLKLVIEGDGSTVKLSLLLMVTPRVVTEIGPVVAPDGTAVVIVVALNPVTVATTLLLNRTAGLALKFVPLIVTTALTAPPVGVKSVIVGVPSTVKLEAEEMVTPLTVTVMGPVVAPAGTDVVILVVDEPVTIA